MGSSDLQADPNGNNFVAIANSLLGALRGTIFPVRSNGQLHTGGGAGAPDIGSPTTPFRAGHFDNLYVGGAELNLASLVKGSTLSAFTVSDRDFAWPYSQSSALAIIAGAESGGGGGGGVYFQGGNNVDTDGRQGGFGAASSITFNGVVYSSGAAIGGSGGAGHVEDRGVIPADSLGPRGNPSGFPGVYLTGPSTAVGGEGAFFKYNARSQFEVKYENVRRRGGFPGGFGYQSVVTVPINGLVTGSILNINVTQAVGAGGAGGADGSVGASRRVNTALYYTDPDPTFAGGAGLTGSLLGYVILIPVGG